MRFRLKTLLLLFFIASFILSATVPFVRWLDSRPGGEFTGYGPGEVEDIKRQLGEQSFQDLWMWHLYGALWGTDVLWRAKVPPEAIGCLKTSMKLKPITENQVPSEFWNMPPDSSETPSWWDPKPIAGAEYYMSPTFVPRRVGNGRLDGIVMYEPAEQRVYVWSQFDF